MNGGLDPAIMGPNPKATQLGSVADWYGVAVLAFARVCGGSFHGGVRCAVGV